MITIRLAILASTPWSIVHVCVSFCLF